MAGGRKPWFLRNVSTGPDGTCCLPPPTMVFWSSYLRNRLSPQYIYFGGILMILSSILEFFLGNTFPAVVFSAFGAFWLTFAGTLLPQFNAFAAYAPADAGSAAEGLQTTEFNSGFGLYPPCLFVSQDEAYHGARLANHLSFSLRLLYPFHGDPQLCLSDLLGPDQHSVCHHILYACPGP